MGYYKHDWYLDFKCLEYRLAANGTTYFVGNKLTVAVVILSFPVFDNVFDNPNGGRAIYGEKRNLLKVYPNLSKRSRMIRDYPTYKKVMEIMNEIVKDLVALDPRFYYGKE